MNILQRLLASMALLFALLAVLAGDFERSERLIDANQIDIYEVAKGIKTQSIILTELSNPNASDAFSLPGALDAANTLAYLDQDPDEKTLVVYGYENNKDWREFLDRGYEIRFLANGVEQWVSRILNPVIYRFASTQELEAFHQIDGLSRYFGGVPKYSNSPVLAVALGAQIDKARRGCGF